MGTWFSGFRKDAREDSAGRDPQWWPPAPQHAREAWEEDAFSSGPAPRTVRRLAGDDRDGEARAARRMARVPDRIEAVTGKWDSRAATVGDGPAVGDRDGTHTRWYRNRIRETDERIAGAQARGRPAYARVLEEARDDYAGRLARLSRARRARGTREDRGTADQPDRPARTRGSR